MRYAIPFALLSILCVLPYAPGAGRQPGTYDWDKAQETVDFVVYVPRHLPPGCQASDPLVVPERREEGERVPGQLYLRLGDKLALWEMARSPLLIPDRIEDVRKLGEVRAWIVGPRVGGYRTIVWEYMGTQFGLTGRYEIAELLRAADSMAPAAPNVPPLSLPEENLPPGGIGTVLWLFGEHFVDEVAQGSPAQAAGIRPGDEIVAVNGRAIQGLEPVQIVGLVRGPVGTKVAITFRRGGQTFTRTLVRARVPTVLSVRRSLKEAVGEVPFPVFTPKWLPKDFHLDEVAVSTIEPDASGEGPHLETVYARSVNNLTRSALISITQRKATGGEPPHAKRFVRVGARSAAVYTGGRGGISLRWQAGPTQVTLHSSGVDFKDVVKVAASMS